MDEALKERLIRYLDSVEGKVDKAIDFTAEQTPLYVQELCQYGAVQHAVPIVASAVGSLIVLVLLVIVFIGTRSCADKDDRAFVRFFTSFAAAMIWLGCFLCIAVEAPNLYKCMYCPRVYVVEQISEMVR